MAGDAHTVAQAASVMLERACTGRIGTAVVVVMIFVMVKLVAQLIPRRIRFRMPAQAKCASWAR